MADMTEGLKDPIKWMIGQEQAKSTNSFLLKYGSEHLCYTGTLDGMYIHLWD